jgi:hypothetical protein
MQNYKSKRQKTIIILIGLSIFLSINQFEAIKANPLPPKPTFFNNLTIGFTNETLNLRHVQAQVTIDVFDSYSFGNGTYLLENTSNSSNAHIIGFSTGPSHWWITNSNKIGVLNSYKSVTVNNTPVETYKSYNSILIPLNFTPYSMISLEIQWTFNSTFESLYQPWFKMGRNLFWEDHRQLYYTAYTINGGQHWNNQSIEHEKVSFRFHTKKFNLKNGQFAIKITNTPEEINYPTTQLDWQNEVAESTRFYPEIKGEVQEIVFEYEEILNDLHIAIINDNSYYSPSILFWWILGLIILNFGYLGRKFGTAKIRSKLYLQNYIQNI